MAAMFTCFLAEAINVSPVSEKEGKRKTSHDLEEIEELNINEECIIGWKSKIGELINKGIMSDRAERKQ